MFRKSFVIVTLFVLVFMAVKKSWGSEAEGIALVPGYPAPVALVKAEVSAPEDLSGLPSAKEYAEAIGNSFEETTDPAPEVFGPEAPVMKVASKEMKKSFVAKKGFKKNARAKLQAKKAKLVARR